MSAQQVKPVPAVMGLEEWTRYSTEGFGSSAAGEHEIKLSLYMVALSKLREMDDQVRPFTGTDRARSLAPDIALGLFDMGLKVVAGRLMTPEQFEVPGSRYPEYQARARLLLDAYDAHYAPAAQAIARGDSVAVALPDGAGSEGEEGLTPLIRFLNGF